MKTLAQRLKFQRERLGLSQPEVARRVREVLGGKQFSQQAYQQLESGKAQNSVNLPAICEVLGVELKWVRDGIGPIPALNEDDVSKTLPQISSVELDLCRQPRNVIIEADVRSGAGGGGVPHSELKISDSNGNSFAAEGIAGEWSLPPQVMSGMLHAAPHQILAFEVIGDSMEPRLREGDRVFVDRRMTFPNPPGIFVLWDGSAVVVKRVEIVQESDPVRIRLISANSQYTPYEVLLDEANVIGRFVGRFTAD